MEIYHNRHIFCVKRGKMTIHASVNLEKTKNAGKIFIPVKKVIKKKSVILLDIAE